MNFEEHTVAGLDAVIDAMHKPSNAGADTREDSVRQASDTPFDACSASPPITVESLCAQIDEVARSYNVLVNGLIKQRNEAQAERDRFKRGLILASDTFRDFERVNRAIGRAEQATAAGIAREACDEALAF